jgi:hypothetical protein
MILVEGITSMALVTVLLAQPLRPHFVAQYTQLSVDSTVNDFSDHRRGLDWLSDLLNT